MKVYGYRYGRIMEMDVDSVDDARDSESYSAVIVTDDNGIVIWERYTEVVNALQTMIELGRLPRRDAYSPVAGATVIPNDDYTSERAELEARKTELALWYEIHDSLTWP